MSTTSAKSKTSLALGSLNKSYDKSNPKNVESERKITKTESKPNVYTDILSCSPSRLNIPTSSTILKLP